MKIKLVLGLTVLLFLFVISGCGGGGGGGGGNNNPPKVSKPILKGMVQKGLFSQLSVAAFPIDESTGTLGTPVETTSTNSNYQLELSAEGFYQLQATGTFLNEVTGEATTLDEPLLLVVDVVADASGAAQQSNINLYTSMAAAQAMNSIENGAAVGQAISDADTFVRQLVGLDAAVDLTALDITAINANVAANDPNLQLLLFSANVLLNADSQASVLGDEITNFGRYTTPAAAATGLSVLGGTSADVLYELIQPNLENAPTNLAVLDTDLPVFVCTGASCGWQTYTQPTVSITGSDLLESDGKVILTIKLSRRLNTGVQVQLNSVDLTARKGLDYRPDSQIITIPANQLEVKYTASLILDNSSEATESIAYTLSAIGDTYAIAQGMRIINILDGYGAVQNVADNLVEISSLCLSGMGDGLNIQSNGCIKNTLTGLPQTNTAALAIDLSLKIVCDLSIQSCAQSLQRNWLVELSLESISQNLGSVQAQQKLGYYWFPGNKITKTNTAINTDTVLAHLDSAAIGLLNTARDNNLNVRIAARLVQSPQVPSVVSAIQQPVRLPAQINAGNQRLTYSVNNINQATGCEGDNYLIDGQFSMDGELYYDATLCINISQDSNNKVSANLQNGQQLTLAGSRITLPAFHSSHIVYADNKGNRLQTLGANYLIVPSANDNGAAASQRLCTDIDCFRGQGLSNNAVIEDLSTYLHAEGLPFAFKVTSGYLDNTGIKLNYSARKYLHSGEYARLDKRNPGNGEKIISNDIFYKESSSGTLRLTSNGINDVISVSNNVGLYAFPKAQVAWRAFSFNIVNSQISGLSSIPVDFILAQSSRCKGCGLSPKVVYSFEGNLSLDGKGAALGQLTSKNNTTPAWGWISGQRVLFGWVLGKRAFQRPGDIAVGSSAMISLPGYIFDLPEQTGVDSLLLSHIEKNSNILIRHPLASAAAVEGNEWPTGITLGPQTYFDTTGVPVAGTGRMLDSTNLVMNNGIDPAFNKAVNIGAKYVVRNNGITGVFNLDINPAVGDSMLMYGYDMRFSRFAFRLTDNTLDDYSWIDGRIHLPGSGNFDTEFTSLSLGCDAKFGSGMVTYCGKPGCQQSLSAWRADTDISNMSFTGANGLNAQACVAESQQLELDQTVEMFALHDDKNNIKPVGIVNAIWSPAGEIISNNLAPLQDMILDEKITKQGFAMAPRQGGLVLLDEPAGYGVIELKNTLMTASRFWDVMKTDVRLANDANGLAAAKSVVVNAGELSNIVTQQTGQDNDALASSLISDSNYEAYSPQAKFTWANSSLGFSLPVYYVSGEPAQQASYFGRYKKTDLLIMKAGAGVDYIHPDATKLSFGVSANIPDASSLALRLDLSNYTNLGNVDNTLGELGISINLQQTFSNIFPIQPLLEDILNKGNSGILFAIEETLDEILTRSADVQINRVNVNLWQELAEPISALQSIPLQLDVIFEAGISESFRVGVYQKSLDLRTEFERLNTVFIDNALEPVTNTTATAPIISSIDSIKIALEEIQQVNDRARPEAQRAFGRAQELFGVVGGRIRQQISRLDAAINRVSGDGGILQQALSFNQLACSDGTLLPENAGFLRPGVKQINNVKEVIDIFSDITNVVNVIGALYVGESELNQLFRQTVEELDVEMNLLKTDFNNGVDGIRGAICGNADYLRQAKEHFQQLQLQVNDISLVLQTAQMAIVKAASQVNESIITVNQYIGNIEVVLNDVQQQLRNPTIASATPYTIGILKQQLDEAIANLSFGSSEYRVDVLFAAQGSAQFDLHTGVIAPLYLKMRELPADIRQRMLQINFKGAYFSADQYKQMIISSIMNSDGIAEIRRDINQFLQSYIDAIISAQLTLSDQINQGINAQIAKIASPLNDLIAKATAELPIPFKAASMDGSAIIEGEQLSRIHIGAEFETPSTDKDVKGNKFKGSFDAYRQSASDGSENCGTGGVDTFTAGISAEGPIDIGDSKTEASIGFKFIFQPDNSGASAYIPVGLNGYLTLTGEMEKDPFLIQEMSFAAGLGLDEVYLGAGGTASFESTQLGLYAFIGRTCDDTVITKDVDPEAASYISLGGGGIFTGIYARGRATIPLLDYSCALNASASANIGAWLTVEPNIELGGIIGGALMGELACIGSIRGQVDTSAAYNTQQELYFAGNAFAVAGIGPDCDAGSWTSKSRSRNDDWCGTADISIKVKYADGEWETTPDSPSAIH